MKKYTYFVAVAVALLGLVLMPIEAQAQLPVCNVDLGPSFPVPFDTTNGIVHGIAFDGNNLWAAYYDQTVSGTPPIPGRIYKLGFDSLGNMIVEDYFNSPTNHPTGTTFVGKNLHCGADDTKVIYKIGTGEKYREAFKQAIIMDDRANFEYPISRFHSDIGMNGPAIVTVFWGKNAADLYSHVEKDWEILGDEVRKMIDDFRHNTRKFERIPFWYLKDLSFTIE